MKKFTLFLGLLILTMSASAETSRQRQQYTNLIDKLGKYSNHKQADNIKRSFTINQLVISNMSALKRAYTHKLDSVLFQNITVDTEVLENESLDEFIYDDAWRATTIIEKEWIPEAKAWEIWSQTEFTYNDAGLVNQMIISGSTYGGAPLTAETKIDVYYDQTNRLDSIYAYTTEEDKTWYLSMKQYFYYNASGQLSQVDMAIFVEEEDEDKSEGSWRVVMKTKYTYDAHGRRESMAMYSAFGDTEMMTSETNYFYNPAGQLTRSETSAMNWDTFQVALSDKTEYTYDGDGDMISSEDFEREGDIWVPNYRDNFEYLANLDFSDVAYPYAAYATIYANLDEVPDQFKKTIKETNGYLYIDGDYRFTDKAIYYYSPTSATTEEFTLTYVAGNHGQILGETTQKVLQGNSGTEVEAVPDEGYHFDEWSDGVKTPKRTDTNVTRNITVTAFFAANTYTITAAPNNEAYGTVSGAGEYSHGQTASLVATSKNAEAYVFMNWMENGTAVHDQAEYSFTVTANRTLTANFQNVTSVNEGLQATIVKAFPNPARHTMVIESPEIMEHIAVYDMAGRQLIAVAVNGMRHELNTTSLESGSYILQAITGRETVTARFVIE